MAVVLGMHAFSTAGSARTVEPVVRDSTGIRAFRELADLYADQGRPPAYEAALDSMRAGTPGSAIHAGAYLRALYAQSVDDESNGRARWAETPYWGGGAQSAAREFRRDLVMALGRLASGAAALPVADWALAHEPVAEFEDAMAPVLTRIPAPAVTPLVSKLLAGPHPSTQVLIAAIGVTGREHLVSLLARLRPLCDDPRQAVRDSARAVVARLGGRVPGLVTPGRRIAPRIDTLLRDIAARVMPAIPRTARWCRFDRETGQGANVRTTSTWGWRISQRNGWIDLVDDHGMPVRMPAGATRVHEAPLADYARGLMRTRAQDPTALSKRGGLTAQFEPGDIALGEANVAAWCYRIGERAAAIELLAGRLDESRSLTELEDHVRWLAGTQAHLAMLEAFSYHRDYDTAIRWGRHLARSVFDGYEYQSRGGELAAQLATRRDDFRAFALPDSQGWRRLQSRLTRGEQIRFLAKHLRLLNDFQWGQPGGVSLGDPQFAEASHLSRPFDEVVNHSRKVINPLVELDGLKPTLADVPVLFPFLDDRDFLPTFEFWRDFSPERKLYRVCELVQDEINNAARQPLVDAEAYATMDPAARGRYRMRVLDWAARHDGWPAVEMDLETLAGNPDQNVFWDAADRLARRGEPRAASIILKRIDEFRRIREYMLTDLRVLRSAEAVPLARRWLADPGGAQASYDPLGDFERTRIQFECAIILLQHTDWGRHEGWGALRSIFEHDREGYWVWQAPMDILETRDSLAVSWYCEQLGSGGYRFGNLDLQPVYPALLRAGCLPLMNHLQLELASDSVVYRGQVSADDPTPRLYVAGDRAAEIVAPFAHGNPVYYSRSDDSTRADMRRRLQHWMDERVRRFQAGARADTLFR